MHHQEWQLVSNIQQRSEVKRNESSAANRPIEASEAYRPIEPAASNRSFAPVPVPLSPLRGITRACFEPSSIFRPCTPPHRPKTQLLPALPQDPAYGFSAGFDSMLAKECAGLVERLSTAVRWLELFGKKTLAKGVKDAQQALAFARRLQNLRPGVLNPVEQELLVPLIPLLCSIYEPRLQKACQRKFGYGLSQCIKYRQEHEEYLAEQGRLVGKKIEKEKEHDKRVYPFAYKRYEGTGYYKNSAKTHLAQTDSVSEYHTKELSKIDSLLAMETGAEELLREENLPDEIIQAAIAAAKEIVHYASSRQVMHSNISEEMKEHRSFAVVTLVQQLNHLKSGLTDGSLCGRLGKYLRYADLLCMQHIKWPVLHQRSIPAAVRVSAALSQADVQINAKTIVLRLPPAYNGSIDACEFRKSQQRTDAFHRLAQAAECLGMSFEVRFNCDRRIFPAEEKRWECLETFVKLHQAARENPADQ